MMQTEKYAERMKCRKKNAEMQKGMQGEKMQKE